MLLINDANVVGGIYIRYYSGNIHFPGIKIKFIFQYFSF